MPIYMVHGLDICIGLFCSLGIITRLRARIKLIFSNLIYNVFVKSFLC